MMKKQRAGFTLVELLVVLLLGAIVMTSVYKTLITQERTIRQSYAVIGTQSNSRTAMEIIAADLRELSATDGDIIAADSISITIHALRKAGIVCDTTGGGSHLDVAELGEPFDNQDSVLVFSDGPNQVAGSDDAWLRRNVSGTGAPSACLSSPVSSTIHRMNLGAPVTFVYNGALVRSFKNITYTLVDSAGKGMLRRTVAGAGGGTANVIEDLATVANRGLRLAYWDSTGTAMPYNTLNANLTTIGRIQVKVAGTMVGGQTGSQRNFTDSLFTTIQMRGNRRLR